MRNPIRTATGSCCAMRWKSCGGESGLLTEEFAASLGHAGIAVLLYLRAYHAVEVTQCFTKIRKEIENQRDLFWNVQATVCLGSRRDSLEQVGESMREALWLCRDRLCRPQSWRDAALEMPDLARRYQMDASRKKSFQVAAECLDEVRFVQELERAADGGGAAGPERADGGGLVPPGSGGMPLRNAPKR